MVTLLITPLITTHEPPSTANLQRTAASLKTQDRIIKHRGGRAVQTLQVQGLGFRVEGVLGVLGGFGFRVWGLGFGLWVSDLKTKD